ncbi:MAG: hypothetical protein IKG88_01185 [Bacteroidales bacterium]|nr:hypothetical protein [Bacteroidales bacterium]
MKTLFFLSSPIPLPPFFSLLQTLSSQHPFCRFPPSIAAIPFIHRSHPLYPSQPSPLSIAAIPSIHFIHPLYPPQPSPLFIAFILSLFAINPLSPHSPFPSIPASLTVKPFLTFSLALLHRGAENLFIYEFVRHKGRRELEKNRQKPNW